MKAEGILLHLSNIEKIKHYDYKDCNKKNVESIDEFIRLYTYRYIRHGVILSGYGKRYFGNPVSSRHYDQIILSGYNSGLTNPQFELEFLVIACPLVAKELV